jgi:hypothetical protein
MSKKVTKEKNKIQLHKLPSLLLKIFIIILATIALISFFNKLMEYQDITLENERLQEIHNNKTLEIDELEYLLNSEINREYKERMARFMGFCYPDETVYYFE